MEGKYQFLDVDNATDAEIAALNTMLFSPYNKAYLQPFHLKSRPCIYDNFFPGIDEGCINFMCQDVSMITVFLKTVTWQTIALDISPSQYVSALKDYLEDMLTIPKPQQRLSYLGMELHDDCTIRGCKLPHEAVLQLDLRVCGGGGYELFGKIYGNLFKLHVEPSEGIAAFWNTNQDKSEVLVLFLLRQVLEEGYIVQNPKDGTELEAAVYKATYTLNDQGVPVFTAISSALKLYVAPNFKPKSSLRSKKTFKTPKYVDSDDNSSSDDSISLVSTANCNSQIEHQVTPSAPKLKQYKCETPMCKFATAHRGSLYKHLKTHNKSPGSKACPVEPCSFQFSQYHELDLHLESVHNQKLVVSHHTFNTEDEFDDWKNTIWIKDCVKFVCDTSTKKTSYVLYCHRSGIYKCSTTPATRKRRTKNAGTIKIGWCPCRLHIKKYENSINVTYHKTHIGHRKEQGKIGLSVPQKFEISTKLREGVPMPTIIDSIGNKIGDTINRIDITSMKDLHNIATKFKIGSDEKLASSDTDSVDAHVRRLRQEENSIILYKRQGELNPMYHKIEEDDFLLGYMNNGQEKMLRDFGKNAICIDSTHGLNAYDFHLTTVVVIDEYQMGFPVAFFVHNRKTQDTYETLFQAIKDRVGALTCKVFMTDDEVAFHNAWALVMGKPDKKLLCAWHVLNNWQKNLGSVPLAMRDVIWAQLQAIMRVTHVPDFEVALNTFIENLNKTAGLEKFATYFKDNYAARPKEWAYCHRFYAGSNTNMYLETMHKTIKHKYLHGKKTKRLDRGFIAVLKFLREQQRRQIMYHYRQPLTPKDIALREAHDRCKGVSSSLVTPYQNYWIVKSFKSSNPFTEYEIRLSPPSPESCGANKKCVLMCPDCNTCVHKYRCSCIPMGIKTTMCKHIHLLCIYIQEKIVIPLEEACDEDTDLVLDTCDYQESVNERLQAHLVDLANPTISNNDLDLTNLRAEIEETVDLVKDVEGKKILQDAIRKAKFAITSHNNPSTVQMKMPTAVFKQPANTKIKSQRSFFRTSKSQPKKKKLTDPEALALLSDDNVLTGLCKVRLHKGDD